jgi:hypothetical protein
LQQGGGDVGPVGKADGNQPGAIDGVVRGGGIDEVGEGMGATRDLGRIEDALGEAGEETAGTVFADIAPRTQESGAG